MPVDLAHCDSPVVPSSDNNKNILRHQMIRKMHEITWDVADGTMY